MSQRGVSQGNGSLFSDSGQDGLMHRVFLRGEGFGFEDVRRNPVIGIATSASELNPCNAGLAELSKFVKEGITAAGGLALEFPTISISEPFTRPTSLYLRNLMSMDVEEMISTAPIDGVVLLGGCDKTIPAQIMGALSANKPAVLVAAGPRPVSCFGSNRSFTIDDVWPMCDKRRVGEVSDSEWEELEGCVNVGVGTCNVLGTATTMAAIAEMLGFALPGSTLPPAASQERCDVARKTGEQIVETIRAATKPRDLVTEAALENAFRVVTALGGSTNALIHLEAIAGRAGHRIGIENFGRWSAETPYLANVRPGGELLLEDLQKAGGIPAVVNRISDLLDTSTTTATGKSWDEVLIASRFDDHPAIAPRDKPLSPRGGLVTLRGSLAPRGAVLKIAGAHEPALQHHRGRVVVFEGLEDLNRRIDSEDLDVDRDSILVLRGLGVHGAPGMPEVGHIPIPAKLHRQGVRDMVRISDARMSGTSTGTVVVHVTPEAVAGGPLGILRTGDEVELNTTAGTLNHFLTDEEVARRKPLENPHRPTRGFSWLHQNQVLQADFGCDFEFLLADEARELRPSSVPERAHS